MEPPAPPSDRDLLERSRSGDFRAFRLLVERFSPRLRAMALGMVGPGPEADEVVQASFLRFHRHLDHFQERASLATYLTRIAMNEALKVIQQRQRRQFLFRSWESPGTASAEPAQPPESSPLETSERHDLIRRAVQSLKPEFRSVVVLRFLNGCSTEECAGILRIPPGTVMSRLSRALDQLHLILQPLREHVEI